MSEPLIRHESFKYREDEPFIVKDVYSQRIPEENLFNHWHEELEILYVLEGDSHHYIDGVLVEGKTDRLVVTNSESVHSIIPENQNGGPRRRIGILLFVHTRFLKENFPDYKKYYFTSKNQTARPEIKALMINLSEYWARKEYRPYDYLYAKGCVLQLLYYLCEEGVGIREDLFPINTQKNIERLKGVFQYLENHYRENLVQADVAGKFYFSREYFSRYFKKCTGLTFTDYMTRYRLEKARHDLINTSFSVLEIALNNGFSDDRRLINAFKKQYHTTPLQYRKQIQKNGSDTKW